jgi:DNA-binding LytR/AlgR family response regulator
MAKRRSLIVEDDVLIALDLQSIVLEAVDAEILLSRSVARAKDLIKQSVDLALLDVDVTNGKTFEVATLLKFRRVPFVFLSGSRREHVPSEFHDAPFLTKPFDPRRVAEQIRKLIPDAQEAAAPA